jgi:hypothetical protein
MKYSIVGMQFRGTEAVVKATAAGTAVKLVREPKNEYDANAIQVWIDDKLVGYIPKKENHALAASMDKDGEDITGTFTRKNDGWPAVEIG